MLGEIWLFENQDFYHYCSAALAPKCLIFTKSWRRLMQFHCLSSSAETRAPNRPRFWGKYSLMLTFKTFSHHRQHFHVASCDLAADEGSCDTTPLTPEGKHQSILLSF